MMEEPSSSDEDGYSYYDGQRVVPWNDSECNYTQYEYLDNSAGPRIFVECLNKSSFYYPSEWMKEYIQRPIDNTTNMTRI